MNFAAEVLVVILSVFLTVFLILGIILTVYLISLTRKIRKVTASAENTVGDIESLVSKMLKVVSPMFAAEMVASFLKKFKTDKEKEDKK